jgi:hypothetical protein
VELSEGPVDGTDRIEGLVLEGEIAAELDPSVYDSPGGESTKRSDPSTFSAGRKSICPGDAALPSAGDLGGNLNLALPINVLRHV